MIKTYPRNGDGNGLSAHEKAWATRRAAKLHKPNLEPVPRAQDAEEAAIGCVLLAAEDKRLQENVAPMLSQLSAALFNDIRLKVVLEHLKELNSQGLSPGSLTLLQRLRDKNKLKAAGDAAFLAGLTQKPAFALAFPDYLETLKQKAKRRQLIEMATRVMETAQDVAIDPGALLDDFAEMANDVARNGARRRQWVKFSKPSDCRSWEPPADWVLVGDCHVTRGDMTILAGPPGCGKSRALTWLALCGARGQGQRWFGMEVKSHFKTMIIQAENGPYRLRQDFEEQRSKDLEKSLLISEPPEYGFQFSDSDFRDYIAEQIRAFQPGVIGFDPWNRIVGDDSARDFIEGLDYIRATIATAKLAKPPALVILHHFKKGDGSERMSVRSLMDRLSGSYTLGAGARCILGMLNASDEAAEDRIVITCAKNSNGALGERSAWHRRGSTFVAVDEFDWAEFEKPAEPGTAKITKEVMEEFFKGKTAVARNHAAKELAEMGYGRSAAYNALKTGDGRFAAHLREQNGLLIWSSVPNLQPPLPL